MEIGQRLQILEKKVDTNGAGIKENGERITRVERKVEENSAGIKKNGEMIDRLIEGQEQQRKQSAEYFEFFKVYFDSQQEETRRHVEVLIERFQSNLTAQGEGIQTNRENTQKIKKSAKKTREKLAEHETRIRNLEGGGGAHRSSR